MTVVLGINDKNVAKYIRSMVEVNVLTELKSRDTIIDKVIEFNPNIIIISKNLNGNFDYNTILSKLKEIKPNLKIVFLYGEKDEQTYLFLDFLVSLKIYDFSIGKIDAYELENLIVNNKSLSEVEQFILSEKDKDRLMNIVVEKKPIVKSNCENETEILITETVEPNRLIPLKEKTLVAVAGTQSRIGTTTQALQLVKYLTHNDVAACYVQANDSKHLEMLQELYTDVKIDMPKGLINYYKTDLYFRNDINDKLLNENYSFYIYDFGVLDDYNFDSFYSKDIKLLVSGAKAWEVDNLYSAFDYIEEIRDLKILFSFVDNDMREMILESMDEKKDNTYFSECCFEPFKYNSFMDNLYYKILQSFLVDKARL